jgi:ParB-like chromosome segregation protein Spo0J
MEARKLKISEIQIGERHRKDMGDIAGLAKSIAEIGLLHPIVLNSSNTLIAGERRFEALKKLGWHEIPVTIVNSLDDAHKAMMAELDENAERKPFTPSEAALVGQRIEVLVKEEAKKRMLQGKKTPSVTVTEGSKQGDTREIVADAVGMSGPTYDRAKRAVKNGVPEVIEAMDRGEIGISTAALIAVEPPEKQPQLLDDYKTGRKHVPRKAAPTHNGNGQMIPKTRKIPGRKAPAAIRGAIGTLIGLASGLDDFTVKDATPSAEEVLQWEADLASVIAAINRFRRQIKEFAHV